MYLTFLVTMGTKRRQRNLKVNNVRSDYLFAQCFKKIVLQMRKWRRQLVINSFLRSQVMKVIKQSKV
jgi:hypothetical protein